jgi:aspartyl-tRNA(Asn)/glutamyl-tRNA(Gln) amidotransferase subunit A
MTPDVSDLTALTACDLLDAYASRALSPVEVVEATLARIDHLDGPINAFVTLTPERALADARRAEAAYAAGDAPPLAGVPYTLKDLLDAEGIPTGHGSPLFRDPAPAADAPVAARLRAGALLGKTTTPERGWKGDSGNTLNGACHNPWRHGRTAGGSSGGAAAAAAAGFGPLHQGSDGAGSIRIPAGFCGVVGHKPSYGLVPNPPAANMSISHIGPIARTVEDAALLLDAMAGPHPLDRLSVPAPVASFRAALAEPPPPLRIGLSTDLGYAAVEPAVVEAVRVAARAFADGGHSVEEADLRLEDPWPIEDEIWLGMFAADLADRTDGRPIDALEGLSPGLRTIVERGATRTAADLAGAFNARTRWCATLADRLAPYDLLLTPTLPCVAFPAGDDAPETVAGSPVSYLSWTAFTYPFNLSGQPAATVPCGLVDGLPVGLQIVGRRLDDALVLRAARLFEEARPFRLPPL